MATIIAIVEGHGEVAAVPVLLRRIASEVSPLTPPQVRRPVRVRRKRCLQPGELERHIKLAARLGGPEARILILLDANGDCPAELAPVILKRARAERSDRRIEVVLAKREYETWLLAGIESLRGETGSAVEAAPRPEVEGIRGVKGRLDQELGPYRPTANQAAFTARFDMAAARRRAPSFDKMWRAVTALLED